MNVSVGFPEPFGTYRFKNGVNFSLCTKSAHVVTLCLFLENEVLPFTELVLNPKINKTGDVWHILVHELPLNLKYAYRIGAHNEFDQTQFLLDPFAKAVSRKGEGKNIFYLGAIDVDSSFDWQGVSNPAISMKDLIIYEMHVRGFTKDPSSQVTDKGTFLGLIEKISYLKDLGINCIELMPVQEFNEHDHLALNPLNKQPLFNYWGYSTLNFFSLHSQFLKDQNNSLIEFKTMVRELHKNGIEIILDVVFNHTGEGNQFGPTISFKGIDNHIYYIMDSENNYANYTGCGNTVSCNRPTVANFILEVLRYFVLEMHVDGFRFDLCTILNLDKKGNRLKSAPIIDFISEDPILATVKLIAEPWDPSGQYQVGSFYPEIIRWSEWNGKYRNTVRAFINGLRKNKSLFATRICGSEDLYKSRSPFTSVNFITCHDGFSLNDLVSYNQKHNIENGEDNKDGHNENLSWNCGVEGVTDDQGIISLRDRQMKNFHFTLMISQGVPMLFMGDEYGHTKNGNNNAWCQDNPLNWFQWALLEKNKEYFTFYKKMIAFRNKYSIFRKETFLRNEDIIWHGFNPNQSPFENEESFIAFTLIDHESGINFYIAINAMQTEAVITLPSPPNSSQWYPVVNTAAKSPDDFIDPGKGTPLSSDQFTMAFHSALLLISSASCHLN